MAAEGASHDGRPAGAGRSASLARRLAPALVVIAALAVGYALGLHERLSIDSLADSRQALMQAADASPVIAPLLFVLLYAAAIALAFPAASVLTIFGGFLFGWLFGAALVAVAATAGATVLFLVARTAFGDFLRSRVTGIAARLAEGFERDAFSYLLALRLAPVFPFVVVNIVPALFEVRLTTFVAATAIGILPGVLAYTYLGQGVDSVIVAAEAAGENVSLGDLVTPQITLAFAVLAIVAVLPPLIRAWRRRRRAE